MITSETSVYADNYLGTEVNELFDSDYFHYIA